MKLFCYKCEFYEEILRPVKQKDGCRDDEAFGYCHRFPPIHIGSESLHTGIATISSSNDCERSYFSYPAIDYLSWCGEYKKRTYKENRGR
jgi:hypothetical protein